MSILDKIKLLINRIPKDKQGHIFVGAVLALATGWYSIPLAIFLVSLFAIGKEVYDYKHPKNHSVEVMDAFATFAGGAIGLLPHLIIGLI